MECDLKADAADFRIASLIPSVYLPTLLFSIGQGAVIPFIPLFAKELGASVAMASAIVALRGIGTMLFDLPGGVLESRFGDKVVMVLGSAVVAVVAVGASLSSTPIHLAVLILAMGGGWALWILARLSYVSEEVPVDQRGRALALVGGSTRLGTFIGPIVGGVMADRLGLASVFYVQAALGAAAALVMAVSVKGSTRRTPHEGDAAAYRRLLGTAVTHRGVFLTAGVASIALQLLRQARQVLIPLWGESIDLNEVQIGTIFGFSSAMDTALFFPAGALMDRLGRKWAAVPAILILSASLLLLPLTGSFAALFAVGLLAGFGNGLSAGVGMTLGADFAPADARGEFLGMWRLVSDIGTAGGPLVVSGVTAVATLAIASTTVAGLGVGGAAIMAFLVTETLHRRPSAAQPVRSPPA